MLATYRNSAIIGHWRMGATISEISGLLEMEEKSVVRIIYGYKIENEIVWPTKMDHWHIISKDPEYMLKKGELDNSLKQLMDEWERTYLQMQEKIREAIKK